MKNILQNILAVLEKKEKRQFTFLILLDIVISIADILFLALLLWIIRFYIQPGQVNLSFLPYWIRNNSITFIAIFVLLFGIKNWLAFVISRAYFKFISNVAVRISQNKLINYQHALFSEFVNTDTSSHIRNICFQPFEFSQYLLSGIQQIITQIALIVVTIIAILLFNAKLFLLLLMILLPPVIIVFYFIKRKLTAAKQHIQESNERSIRHLLDALNGYVESNIYNRNDFFLGRFINYLRKFSTHLFDSLALQNMPNRIIEIFAIIGLFILIVIAKWTGNNDNATIITIGAFMAAAYKIIPGIVKIINLSGQIKAYEFTNQISEPGKVFKENNRSSLSTLLNKVDLKNVSFQYSSQVILSNFSLTINKGDFIGITGRSGRGKTTILNLLLGFLQVKQGEVLMNDIPVSDNDLKSYWPHISYVRQQNFFIHDSVLRNITMEERGYDKENLAQALNISGLDKIISNFPEGDEKLITENGKNLSGGQQQRIAIARALYKNAKLILLDEPFNELDEDATQSLLQHFKKLSSAGKMVVMITHDKKSLTYCNKIISLDD